MVEKLADKALEHTLFLDNGKTEICVKSAGYDAGNISSILVDGKEYSEDKIGINIVLYDEIAKEVIDYRNFYTATVPNTTVDILEIQDNSISVITGQLAMVNNDSVLGAFIRVWNPEEPQYYKDYQLDRTSDEGVIYGGNLDLNSFNCDELCMTLYVQHVFGDVWKEAELKLNNNT